VIQAKGRKMFKRCFSIYGFFLVLFLFFSHSSFSQDQIFGQNKVQYKNLDWYYLQSRHFDVYFYKGEEKIAEFAINTLETSYLQVKRILQHDLRKRVPVIVYRSQNDFQQTNVISDLIEEGVGGFTETFKNRVVVPFTGSYEDFRHVLHHELTHAVMFDLLYGSILNSVLSRQYFFSVPLWFSEGIAEYASRLGWDQQADMVLRDATINGYLTPLAYVGGFLAYKEGQSALLFLAKKYGEEKISEILNKGRTQLTMDKALKSAIGLDENEFSEEWAKYVKKEYWPEIAQREEPKNFAKQLTDHRKDGSYFNEKPVFSPQGDRLAIFSDKSDYTEVYIISAIDGKVIERLVKGERTGDIESLHSFVSGLSWSPDGKSLTFASKSQGEDALFLVQTQNGKIYQKLKFGFDGISSPSFSPDGERIVFEGLKEGQSDLYSYNLNKKEWKKITDDKYKDQEPAFSPDGKFLAFSSDRPVSNTAPDSNYQYGKFNIFLYNLETAEISPVTKAGENNVSPSWHPSSKKLCFVSNRNGIDNLWVMDLDSSLVYPITNILSGCFSPSWSPDGEKIAFSSFQQGGWDIFVLKNIEPQEALKKTGYYLSLETDTSKTALPTMTKSDTTFGHKPDFSTYVFSPGKTESDTLLTLGKLDTSKADTLKYQLPSGEYKKNKYKLKFSADLLSGGFSYDTFFGLRGQTYILLSDIFGNHNILIATDVINTIDQSNFEIFYQYSPKRIDWGVGILHTKNYYVDSFDRLFSDRVYGGLGFVAYPFSKFSRLELNISHISIDRKYYDPPFDNRSVRVLSSSLSLINDTVLWGITGPVNGTRSIFSFDFSPDISPKTLSYRTFFMDYRKYWHFKKRYDFAVKLSCGTSGGKDPQKFYLGGISNWISPRLATQNIYGVRDLYFSSIITPLRGYDYFAVQGTSFALLNLELRYPFIDHFAMRFPLPMTLSYVTGAWFLDIGGAWDESKKFHGGTYQGGAKLDDWKAGFGFGARANLGIVVLRFDTAWRTDFATVSAKPILYFSLGAEF
jgi:Tol biopolymer transport system component